MTGRALGTLWGVAAVLLATGVAAAADGDHPLISRYPASTLTKHEAKDFDRYKLIVGLDAKGGMKFDLRDVEGRLTRIVYTNPAGRSTLEIYQNYRQALEAARAEVLFACEIDVGHTDTTGALDHNLELSAARARAVVEAFARGHGLAPSRLDAHGAGPLAPVAPNTSDEGRQLNRRVEIVAR